MTAEDRTGCGCLLGVACILTIWFPLAPWLVGWFLKIMRER